MTTKLSFRNWDIAIMVDILEWLVRVTVHNYRGVEVDKSEISYLRKSIINSIQLHSHLVSCHTQEYESNIHVEIKYKADRAFLLHQLCMESIA